MTRVCMVKSCPGKKRAGEKYSLHEVSLHKPEVIQQWMEMVDVKSGLTHQRICSLHFDDASFMKGPGGKRLRPDAVPLPYKENGEKLLNIKSSSFLKENKFKTETSTSHSSSMFEPQSDRIYNFDCFAIMLASLGDDEPWKENWNIFEQHDGICFYRLSRDEYFSNVIMSFKILVDKEMNLTVYKNETQADRSELNWILKLSRLEKWSQFHRLLEYYQTEPIIQPSINSRQQIERAIESLNKIWNAGDLIEIIDPIKRQLSVALHQLNPNHEVAVKVEIVEPQVDSLSLPIFEQTTLYEDIQVKTEPLIETIMDTTNEPSSPSSEPKIKKIYKRKSKSENKSSELDEEVVKCEQCDKIMLKSALGRHSYNVHNGPGFCDRCGKKFNSRKKLREHLKIHEGIARVKCPHCDDVMQHVSLSRHIKVRHQGYKPFGCSFCGKMFSTGYLAKEHEKIHDKKKKATRYSCHGGYKCHKCNKQFDRGGSVIDNHINKCRGVLTDRRRSFKFPCFECGKIFYSKVTCAEHLALVHKVNIPNIEKFCFECKTEVENPRRHAMTHNNAFECNLCGICLATKEKLEKHMERHKCNEKRPFKCDICFLTFKTNNHAQGHKLSVHCTEEEKPYTCTVCLKRFSFKNLLNTHFVQSHSEEKRYSCPFCSKKFRQTSAVKSHALLIHGEDSTYLCIDCPEKFKILNDLKKHRQDCH